MSEASAGETRYLGVDLAWSGTALSGVSATDARGRVLGAGVLSNDDLLRWIAEHRGLRSVLAIDAPLFLRAHDAHAQAGGTGPAPTVRAVPQPARFPVARARRPLARRTASRALEIVQLAGGYSTDPFARRAQHRAIEVFPAPAWITLGGRASRIRYKRGRLQERVAGLSEARQVLRSVIGPDATLGPSFEAAWAAARTAREWKSVEDMVDARLCAHVALLWDTVGTDEWVPPATVRSRTATSSSRARHWIRTVPKQHLIARTAPRAQTLRYLRSPSTVATPQAATAPSRSPPRAKNRASHEESSRP